MVDTVHLLKTPRVSLFKYQGLCTCHNPPLDIHREGANDEWQHVIQSDFAYTYHVHEETNSRDCDGPLEVDRTHQITSWRYCKDEYDLWTVLVRFAVPAYGYGVTVNIQNDPYDKQGKQTCAVDETTDEGFHHISLRGCWDVDCAHEGSRHRDVYAEQMGY